ncbi:MAG: UDP-N-acetylmuramoyl-tripeptide--D-alanyl-D-alanine ligase [Alcanivoracaceae bacterium]
MMLSRAALLCDGQVQGADVDFTRVCTDTRAIRPGDLFVALRGARFDGHDFVVDAVGAGAVAAMVESPQSGVPSLVVSDTRRGLGLLAAGRAADMPLFRIAVTGNAGKTTVKEMIAAMLSREPGDVQVHATLGNLNNDIGVPLTLLEVRPEHRFGVFELGANAPGEIAWTVSLVKPQVVMVTNVTGAHLLGFGSMQGIANAKAEIFSATAPGALAIINADDSFADFFAARAEAAGLRVVRVGRHPEAAWRAENIQLDSLSVQFDLNTPAGQWPVRLPLPGAHQVSNALMALAAVAEAGVPLAEAIARLANLKPVKGRMNVSACEGGTLVDDSYNANPGSVRVAIDWLARQRAPRCLVLGNLGELGADEVTIHQQLGRYARDAGIDALVAHGHLAAEAADAFGDGGDRVATHGDAAERARVYLKQAGTVLVKGSRSAGMDAVITVLQAHGEMH